MRMITIALLIGCILLSALPAQAGERERLKIVIPANVLAESQAPPYKAGGSQTKQHTIAAIVVLSAIAVLGVVVYMKYGD